MTVHSLAFVDDGRALVLARRRTMTKLSWPAREVLVVHERPSQLVVGTIDGGLLCVSDTQAIVLDASLIEQRRVDVGEHVRAIALDDHGAVLCCRAIAEGDKQHVVERHDPPLPPQEVGRFTLTSGYPWWAALLPTTKRVVFAMNDSAPEHIDWATGAHDSQWQWPPHWEHRARRFASGGQRSWLSVDVAVDERCLVVSDKGQESTVIWLDDVGRIPGAHGASTSDVVRSYVGLEKTQRAPTAAEQELGRFIMKGPARGAAATVHPRDDVVLVVDISGRLHVNDARTGAMLEPPSPIATGGYRWEG